MEEGGDRQLAREDGDEPVSINVTVRSGAHGANSRIVIFIEAERERSIFRDCGDRGSRERTRAR